MNEHDTRKIFIDSALKDSGWLDTQIKYEYRITAGTILVKGHSVIHASGKRADYLLLHKGGGFPLAVIEAKSLHKTLYDGIQQAIEYAGLLNVPFAYSSNGRGFLEHDMNSGLERELKTFPSDSELWQRYITLKGFDESGEKIISQPYYYDTQTEGEGKTPRYYQANAVNKTLEAVAMGKRRILIIMATGTGKTFTAFQIVHRLRQSGKVKRVLYLADRNILIDQPMSGDFKPFDKIMTKVTGSKFDSSYEIFMCLYQQTEDESYKAFKPEFFDLVIVDECHRGSAKEDSQWRDILEYFDSAVQIGMTATPKETREVSSIDYFGEPVYIYSLKQGINDGFLAPYKVIRVGLDIDLKGWTPELGQRDSNGQEIEQKLYTLSEFDRNIALKARTQRVAEHVTQWLKANGRDSKTIIFCVDTEHAGRLRTALMNLNHDITASNPEYIMRITSKDYHSEILAKRFSSTHEEKITIATTSDLLSTGVDIKDVKLIVLDCAVNSIIRFKQIIGRGTRLCPDKDKYFFTIMDFRNNFAHFLDPDFDGVPIQDKDFHHIGDSPNPPDGKGTREGNYHEKIYVINGVEVSILYESEHYFINGNLITGSFTDFTRKNILGKFATLNDFINSWTESDKKSAVINELAEHGAFIQILREQIPDKATNLDDFDLILQTAFNVKAKTRRERADRVRQLDFINNYSEQCRQVLSGLLDKYADSGIQELEEISTLQNPPFDKIGQKVIINKLFGGKDKYLQAVKELIKLIYEAA